MLDVVTDTLLDSLKLLPFLFLTYLAMEYIEHKTSANTKKLIKKSGKAGPVVGAVLGAFPQCGFSAAASNLYAGRIITLGTLISIYLSTSDEMLPIFLTEQVPFLTIIKIMGVKIVIAMVVGFLLDLALRSAKKGNNVVENIGHVCDHDHCHCENGIFKSALHHTIVITFYIIIVSFVLNTVLHFIGEETLGNIILNRPVAGPLLSALVGLIPNCASSVVITQLYVGGVMSVGAMIAGLLTAAGVGLLVLFKENRNIKENLRIIGILYITGAVSGIIIDLFY